MRGGECQIARSRGVDKTVGQYHHKGTKDTEILRVHKGKKLCALRVFAVSHRRVAVVRGTNGVVKSFGEPAKLSTSEAGSEFFEML
jgi:hypothetical protein